MTKLPDHAKPINVNEEFSFACHPGVSCFTECCRELELSLTPYDVLRLKNHLKIKSHELIDQYLIIEFTQDDLHPNVFLGMVDDGQASCPLVSKNGCTVYDNRPGACRTYPVGRGALLSKCGLKEIYVLLQEPHCKGFSENRQYNIKSWQSDQQINIYNIYNDKMLQILNHAFFRNGSRLSEELAETFILSLYNLDLFREKIRTSSIDEEKKNKLINNEIDLLEYAMDTFKEVLDNNSQYPKHAQRL